MHDCYTRGGEEALLVSNLSLYQSRFSFLATIFINNVDLIVGGICTVSNTNKRDGLEKDNVQLGYE